QRLLCAAAVVLLRVILLLHPAFKNGIKPPAQAAEAGNTHCCQSGCIALLLILPLNRYADHFLAHVKRFCRRFKPATGNDAVAVGKAFIEQLSVYREKTDISFCTGRMSLVRKYFKPYIAPFTEYGFEL